MAAMDRTVLLLVGERSATLGASEYLATVHGQTIGHPPALDLDLERRVQAVVRDAIGRGIVRAAHDTSEGGLLVALAEMLIGGGHGAELDTTALLADNSGRADRTFFGEAASRIIVAVDRPQVAAVRDLAEASAVPVTELGQVGGTRLEIAGVGEVEIDRLRDAWKSGLSDG
jgi:phosphoribosylformylglycinamidine synthase